eukprot:10943511-Ditylum_brightwellii.AAC.1
MEKLLCGGIDKYLQLKEESVGPPKTYLGGSVCKCIQAAVKNVVEYLVMPTKAEIPTKEQYRPKLGITPVLSPFDNAYYQFLIGMLRWVVEIGKIDICLEVSLVSSHLVMPREGHMVEVLRTFVHLRKYHNTEPVFDPSNPAVDELAFEQRY